jgi:hypothetical protein
VKLTKEGGEPVVNNAPIANNQTVDTDEDIAEIIMITGDVNTQDRQKIVQLTTLIKQKPNDDNSSQVSCLGDKLGYSYFFWIFNIICV